MNRKTTVSTADAEQNNGQFAVKRNHKADIVAILVCVLIALLVNYLLPRERVINWLVSAHIRRPEAEELTSDE